MPTASDPDGDVLVFGIANRPAWATFDVSTGRLAGTPAASDAGAYAGIAIAVSDGRGGSAALAPFDLVVTAPSAPPPPAPPANRPPTIGGVPATSVVAGSSYIFTPIASDPDGDVLAFGIANRPAWATFDSATGRLSGTPSAAQAGTYASITIAVSDNRGGSATLAPFTITVQPPPNRAPTLSGSPPTSVAAGTAYAFQPTASDPDGDALSFAITNRPAWATFDVATGRLSGTPSAAQAGTYASITIAVSDNRGGSAALAPFTITVEPPPNRAPTISGTPATTVVAGSQYAFVPTASDPDGDVIAFGIANRPAWATFDSATGRLSGTPSAAQAGTYASITIAVSDDRGGSATLAPFTITVQPPPNRAPAISGSPPTSVEAGMPYAFQPTATDPDGDTLSFAIANRPAWASFDTATGRLAGTPTAAQAGTYGSIAITVSDGRGGTAALPPFSIVVSAPANREPTISGTPATRALVDVLYDFRPVARDPDGDPIAFGVANLPAWASFDTSTGRLWGTPRAGDAGTYDNIVIAVSDGRGGRATLPPFAIVVEGPATGTATLSWTAPTQNEDGSPLTTLAGYRIAYGRSAGQLDQSITVADPSATQYVVNPLASGTWYFAVRAYTTTGLESQPSNVASKSIP
jgi:hypothetical protein